MLDVSGITALDECWDIRSESDSCAVEEPLIVGGIGGIPSCLANPNPFPPTSVFNEGVCEAVTKSYLTRRCSVQVGGGVEVSRRIEVWSSWKIIINHVKE